MIPSITDWLMVIITAVYVVATIFICRANIKSAEETRKQTEEMNRQFEESTRAFVTVTAETIRSGLTALHIENHGKRIANEVHISIPSNFISNMPHPGFKKLIETFSSRVFTLGVGQSLYVCLGGPNDFKQLSTEILSLDIDYQDTASKYHESTVIDLTQYLGTILYESPAEDLYQEMKKVTKSLQSIDKSLQHIYRKIQTPTEGTEDA